MGVMTPLGSSSGYATPSNLYNTLCFDTKKRASAWRGFNKSESGCYADLAARRSGVSLDLSEGMYKTCGHKCHLSFLKWIKFSFPETDF